MDEPLDKKLEAKQAKKQKKHEGFAIEKFKI